MCPEKFQEYVLEAYEFFKQTRITYYIDALYLGAALYNVSESNTDNLSMKGMGGLSASGIKAEATLGGDKTEITNSSQRVVIGQEDVENINPGDKNEKVVKSVIVPLSDLLYRENKETIKVVKKGIALFVDSMSKLLLYCIISSLCLNCMQSGLHAEQVIHYYKTARSYTILACIQNRYTI